MKKQWTYRLGASLLALSLMTACGTTNNDNAPEAPANQNSEQDINQNDLNEEPNDRNDDLNDRDTDDLNDRDPDMDEDERDRKDQNR